MGAPGRKLTPLPCASHCRPPNRAGAVSLQVSAPSRGHSRPAPAAAPTATSSVPATQEELKRSWLCWKRRNANGLSPLRATLESWSACHAEVTEKAQAVPRWEESNMRWQQESAQARDDRGLPHSLGPGPASRPFPSLPPTPEETV